jgi:hypothetical protein
MNIKLQTIYLTALFLLAFEQVSGKAKNPYIHLEYDSVVMYSFVGNKGADPFVLNKDGKYNYRVLQKTCLEKRMVSSLHSYLGNKKSFGEPTSQHFEPNVGFVYYHQGAIVAQISICLDCNKLVSSLELEAQKQGKVKEGNHIYFIGEGLSYHFKTYLKNIITKHQLIITHHQY